MVKVNKKPNRLAIVLSFLFFISIFIFFALSNNIFGQSEKYQFLTLIIGAFLSIISYLFYLFYLNSFPKKKEREKLTINYLIGSTIINGLIAIFLSILFFFIIFPFLQSADNLSFEDKAKIGELNILRIALLYGLLTGINSFFTFYKKIQRGVSIFLIIFWMIGVILTIFISTTNKNDENLKVKSNGNILLSDRNTCNKEVTLQKARNCTLLILRDDKGHGSGFVIKPGFLVTNRHVIEGANKIFVWYYKKREVRVWNYLENIDLAILKLPEDIKTEVCRWFDSNKLKIAEELYAFGWPNEPTGESTVTKGIYSRTNKYEDGTEDIQTDAPINPGNSGGPLVNECGIVGINTMRAEWTQEQSPRFIEGMGFALSSNFIYKKVEDLILKGNDKTEIPKSKKITTQKIQENYESNYSLNLDKIKSYLNELYKVKESWQQVKGQIDEQKLNTLIDSFNRQIDFCNHLINKLSSGQKPSSDDINLWNAVVKMSYESAALSKELNLILLSR